MNDPTLHRTRRSFTLVELVVSLGVVVLLAGLTVTAAVAVLERADARRTETSLQLLDHAIAEWERASDRKLTWGDDQDRYDVYDARSHTLIISEVLDTVRRVPGAKEILARIDADSVYTYRKGETPAWIEFDPGAREQVERFIANESISVLDAWGMPVYATHPGAPARPGTPEEVDVDGTERTRNEQLYGIARNRRLCFVSAGPDRRFGLYWEFAGLPHEQAVEAMAKARRDNIYSYEPDWSGSAYERP